MNWDMIAFCGAYCGICGWRDKLGCPGCKASAGSPFWGRCDKALCSIRKGYRHCGLCPALPCDSLAALFADPEHGDKGVRLHNLKNWAMGKEEYQELDNLSQKSASL